MPRFETRIPPRRVEKRLAVYRARYFESFLSRTPSNFTNVDKSSDHALVEEAILLRDERKELSSEPIRARNIDPFNRYDVPRQSAQLSYDTYYYLVLLNNVYRVITRI